MQNSILVAPFGTAMYHDMVALRHEVLRKPLGLAYSAEQLMAEREQLHLAFLHDRRVVGTLLLVWPDANGNAKLRQMAIDPAFERMGFGRLLIERGERELRGQGAERIVLHARENAVGFYEKLGYAVEGEPFVEVTLPHRRMTKLC